MSQRQAAKALKVSQSTIRDDVSRKSSQLSRSHSTKAKRQRSNSGCDYDPHHVDASEPFDAMTANDDPLPCRHGRESVCRLNAGVVDDADDAIEWRWRCQSTPDCGIAVFGALEDGCHCLLDYATHLLQRALLADAVPDIPEIARLITLALGNRGAMVEVRSPQLPGWWFLI